MIIGGQKYDDLPDPEKVGLPPITFFYTLDQIAAMLQRELETMSTRWFYQGRSTGRKQSRQMTVVNIALEDEAADWRVTQGEFVRWLKAVGVRVYARGKIV